MEHKWIRLKLWTTQPYSGTLTTWIIFHKNNPLAVNKDPAADYKMYVLKQIDSPPVSAQEANVNAENFNKLIAKGKKISVPIIGIYTGTGLDGTISGMEFPKGINGFGEYKISWFMEGPVSWKPLINWYNNMIRFLETSLSNTE